MRYYRTILSLFLLSFLVSFTQPCHGSFEVEDDEASLSDDLPQESPRQAPAITRKLVIVGGGETPKEVLKFFWELTGGIQSKWVVIPSAYLYETPEELAAGFADLDEFTAERYQVIDANNPAQLDEWNWIERLQSATGVWIGGGDQGRLADLYIGTVIPSLLQDLLSRGGAIGGTSAGASILSDIMIREGTSESAVVDQGFGLVQGLIIDQHFSQRDRLPRLQALLYEYPGKLGLGIDERTAAVIVGTRLSVLGEGRVWLGRVNEEGELETLADLSADDEAIELPSDTDRSLAYAF